MRPDANPSSPVEDIEIDLLLEAMYRRYGYDFRSYARASVDRRIRHFLSTTGLCRISELIPLTLHDESLFSELAQSFSVSVTEMFRDPFVYRTLRDKVVPVLETFPFVKVWHAGCATGEEVYSLAIVLMESGLYDRTTLFGTDFNDDAIEHARQGTYPLDRIREYTGNYQEAGGTRSLSEYYQAGRDAASMSGALKNRLTFANHNLTADQVFGEMHLVFCRNVLIYFDRNFSKSGGDGLTLRGARISMLGSRRRPHTRICWRWSHCSRRRTPHSVRSFISSGRRFRRCVMRSRC